MDEDRPTAVEAACLGLPSRVTVLETRLVDIDRGARALELPRDGVLPYDALVLTDELVDSTFGPRCLGPPPDKLVGFAPAVAAQLRSGEDSGLALGADDELVEGVVSLSGVRAEELVDGHLDAADDTSSVVVYGSSLEALHAVAGLLVKGVRADRITWVRPGWGEAYGASEPALDASAAATASPLGDPKAEAILTAAVAAAGVAERCDLKLVAVRGQAVGGLDVESATGRGASGASEPLAAAAAAAATTAWRWGTAWSTASAAARAWGSAAWRCPWRAPSSRCCRRRALPRRRRRPVAEEGANAFAEPEDEEPELVELPARLLLTYHEPDVRPSLFRAINNSGLVYDGRLVVSGSGMRTSDGAIFAGGDLTKFSRRYDATAHRHSEHSPAEVGKLLASCVVEALDPLAGGAGGFDGEQPSASSAVGGGRGVGGGDGEGEEGKFGEENGEGAAAAAAAVAAGGGWCSRSCRC